MALWARTVSASGLLPPGVGAADSATQGTRIADPATPSAALFANPAGLTRFETFTHGGGIGIALGRSRIEAAAPTQYAETAHMWAAVPNFGLSAPYGNWRVGLGAYGSTGSKFDFDGNATAGVPSFFSETTVVTTALGVAYRVNERLSIGAQIEPLFGQLRTRYPLSGLDFHYKINGPGVQGALGATWRLRERLSLGVSLRLPGMIWMGGSMPVGDQRQRVECDLKMPAQVFVGATWRLRVPLTMSGSVRYTNARTFGSSTIEYELTPQANTGFLPHSKDEWKFALGAEYAWSAETVLRLGGSWATHIVGSRGVSPLAFDADDIKLGLGAGHDFGGWVLDLMVGYSPPAERYIPPAVAIAIPGNYSMRGMIFMVDVTFH